MGRRGNLRFGLGRGRKVLPLMKRFKPLLDFIARLESNGDYNTVWGGIAPKDRPPKPLTHMTVQEVLNWQDSIDPHYLSEAAGRYQIMEDTLRGLPVRRSARFNEVTQDLLAIKLMERRGLNEYLDDQISAAKFANNLAKEWASLPLVSGPRAGKSYYAGDGLNKAHTKIGPYLEAVKAIRQEPWWAKYLRLFRWRS